MPPFRRKNMSDPPTPEEVASTISMTAEQLNAIIAAAASSSAPLPAFGSREPNHNSTTFGSRAENPEPIPEPEEPMTEDEKMIKAMAAAVATGGNPKNIMRAMLDADGDGKVGLRDIQRRRWQFVVLFIGVFLGTLLMEPGWPVWVVANHWPIVLAAVIAFPSGMFSYWLFKKDIEKVEEQVISAADAALNNAL